LEQELRNGIGKKEDLQKEVEELQANLPLINANLEAFAKEMQVLTEKAENVDLYYHRIVKFETL
jgi:prefoldin subunit 5